MKVIDLLNKIANGEESDTITEFVFGGKVWNFFGFKDSEYCLDEWLLNQEIVITKHKEIIEEDKKIEKLEKYYDDDLEEYIVETYINGVNYKEIFNSKYDEMMVNKINEIIKVLNEMREDKQ